MISLGRVWYYLLGFLKLGLYISSSADHRLANYGSWAKSSLSLVLVNTVLLEQSLVHLFIYCLWLLSCYNSNKTIWSTKPNIYYVILYKKFADPYPRV